MFKFKFRSSVENNNILEKFNDCYVIGKIFGTEETVESDGQTKHPE